MKAALLPHPTHYPRLILSRGLAKVIKMFDRPTSPSPSFHQWVHAQREEAAWWQGVATTGYNGQDPSTFIASGQREAMLQAVAFLDVDPEVFLNACIVEFGPGPAGIVEYLNARKKIAIEPLYEQYRAMFPHLENSSVEYHSTPAEDCSPIADACADLVICYNMLDHVLDPERVLHHMARVSRKDALLLFQVNVYCSTAAISQKSGLHAELHPHSFTQESVIKLLGRFGFETYKQHCSPVANECNEHFFICAAKKTAPLSMTELD